jgi:hypothetical protein
MKSKANTKYYWQEMTETLGDYKNYEVYTVRKLYTNAEESRLQALTDYDGEALWEEENSRRKEALNPDLTGQAFNDFIRQALEMPLPIIYTTAKGTPMTAVGLSLTAVAHDFGYRAIRDINPCLAHEIRQDLITETLTSVLSELPWTMTADEQGPPTEEARKKTAFEVANKSIKHYLSINDAMSVAKCIRKATRELVEAEGIDRRTARKRIEANISPEWLDEGCKGSTSWDEAYELAYNGDNERDYVSHILPARLKGKVKPQDISLAVSIVEGKTDFRKVSHHSPRQAKRIKAVIAQWDSAQRYIKKSK